MSRLTSFLIGLSFLIGVGLVYPAQLRTYETLTLDFRMNHVAVVGDSYTTGTGEGGVGPRSWTSRAFGVLRSRGSRISSNVAAEGRAGYAAPGDHGSIFEDLTARAVQPDDALVVFFGSRNDQGIDPATLTVKTNAALDLARRTAPAARLLVIGPPWPTADVPPSMFLIRDVLGGAARAVGATFIDPIAEHWFVGRPDLIGADGVHPNDAGHQYMADKIAPLIGTQLSI
ncbi:Rv0518 family GDSL lipase [Mycobacterium sp. 94-17]|uniref:Rv0518 family GDSL lipase n=1 Tax=Mycobacterium sp. 94-17 TaxID=2986147 RepID=UPI002D1F4203|nr:GDSL lipase [Mycobacterium sp. 94-17]MEB4208614.1 SGNH/GDSL hydrolase family protein [Mycobacterium sp. 94-17]